MKDSTTKCKILEAARALFGRKGFNGVSIREIAHESDVNVAGVNYHFSSKENLYIETVKRSIQKTHNDIEAIFNSQKQPNTEKLILSSFKLMLENREDIRACLRLLMGTDGVYEELTLEIAKHKGPPGGIFIAKSLKSEFPKAKEKDIQFAVRVIFSHMMHTVMVMSNPSIREAMTRIEINENLILNDIKRLIRAIKSELGES